MMRRIMGTFATGRRGLGDVAVHRPSRVPSPPARMTACMGEQAFEPWQWYQGFVSTRARAGAGARARGGRRAGAAPLREKTGALALGPSLAPALSPAGALAGRGSRVLARGPDRLGQARVRGLVGGGGREVDFAGERLFAHAPPEAAALLAVLPRVLFAAEAEDLLGFQRVEDAAHGGLERLVVDLGLVAELVRDDARDLHGVVVRHAELLAHRPDERVALGVVEVGVAQVLGLAGSVRARFVFRPIENVVLGHGPPMPFPPRRG